MEIILNKTYSSKWDNIEYPILQLPDGSYLCLSYSRNHGCYSINIYTKEEFIEQGFELDEYDDFFDNFTADNLII